jgi:F0F1-type ATP synthase membrane subunit b/b'
MSEKDLDSKVEKIEEITDPNTVISIGGYSFTPAKLMILGGILSTALGGLWGAFEVYKDYMNMKSAIQEYVAPDLSGINEKLSVIQKEMESTKSSVIEATNYTNEIKNDLKSDIRRLEGVVESVERSNKQTQREIDQEIKTARSEMNKLEKETASELRKISKEVDDKIKKALDNPLANK